MHATTVLLSLFAFAIGTIAAPMPLHSAARAVPDINEVARNPAPIDNRVHWEHGKPSLGNISHLSREDLEKLKELIHHLRGGKDARDIENIVVDRSITSVEQPAKGPTGSRS